MFNDAEKAEMFAKKLEKTFQPYTEEIFDAIHQNKVENFTQSDMLFEYDEQKTLANSKHEKPFDIHELNDALKKLKK